MSFNFYLFRGLRLLFFPVSVLVWCYLYLRNKCYDWGWFKSSTFNLPIICIGNLSVGGTGKSPMTEYLLELLLPKYPVAVLSRGYKRKSKGYLLASETSTALELGDEPIQFYKKFPQAAIAVGEERIEAIPQILQDRPHTKLIILDDAFQHRAIKPGFNIILTDFANPYWHDFYLPTGDLRDNKRSAKRADIIIVTKCPETITEEQQKEYLKHINPTHVQKVFFTKIAYGVPYHIRTKQTFTLSKEVEVLLVCGIANPLPLKMHIEENAATYFERKFDDHHIFSIDDWKDIEEKFAQLDAAQKIILTTEKDAVRLEKFGGILDKSPVYVLPIKHKFLFEQEKAFEAAIQYFIENFTFTPPK